MLPSLTEQVAPVLQIDVGIQHKINVTLKPLPKEEVMIAKFSEVKPENVAVKTKVGAEMNYGQDLVSGTVTLTALPQAEASTESNMGTSHNDTELVANTIALKVLPQPTLSNTITGKSKSMPLLKGNILGTDADDKLQLDVLAIQVLKTSASDSTMANTRSGRTIGETDILIGIAGVNSMFDRRSSVQEEYLKCLRGVYKKQSHCSDEVLLSIDAIRTNPQIQELQAKIFTVVDQNCNNFIERSEYRVLNSRLYTALQAFWDPNLPGTNVVHHSICSLPACNVQ
jgi:hypothetical protein